MRKLMGMFMVLLLIAGCSVAKTSTVDDNTMSNSEYEDYAEGVKMDIYSINDDMLILMNDMADMDIADEETWAKTFLIDKNKAERLLDEAKEVNPPSKYEEAHDTLKQGLELYYSAFENIDQFIQTQDMDYMSDASDDVSGSMDYMMDYLDMVDK